MDCSLNFPLSNKEYLRNFNKKVSQKRIPLSGHIALTNRCNLGCIHCYLGHQQKNIKHTELELNSSQWKKVIDEITEAGCLFLLLTGGEPLLRKDFQAIYTHAKKNGLLVSIFSNGTLINDTFLELFTDLPPKVVEITLLGATEQTHEKITGIKGSFEKCLKGINSLKKHKINMRLKTVLMRQNQDEFFTIEKLAEKIGVKFRFDSAIFPTLDGQKYPLELRIRAEDAVEMEFSDPRRFEEWKDFYLRMNNIPSSGFLYRCGAGHSFFYINPFGDLQPCLMVSGLKYNLKKGDFSDGWDTVMPRLKTKKITNDHTCNGCGKKNLCGFCPGFFDLETGSEETFSKYLCDLGQIRYDRINQALKTDTVVATEGESLEIETN